MGSGKSTIAERLSNMLDIKNIEMDDLVLVKSERKSINEIFEKDGEECFRKLEAKVAAELSNREDVIVATGGGVGTNQDLLKVLGGVSIYLEVDFEEIEKRLKNDQNRPLFKDIKEAEKLYKERKLLYKKNADHIISTNGKSVDEIVQEIIKKLFFMCEGGRCGGCSGCH